MSSCIIFHFEAVSSENALVSQTAIKDLASPPGLRQGPRASAIWLVSHRRSAAVRPVYLASRIPNRPNLFLLI